MPSGGASLRSWFRSPSSSSSLGDYLRGSSFDRNFSTPVGLSGPSVSTIIVCSETCVRQLFAFSSQFGARGGSRIELEILSPAFRWRCSRLLSPTGINGTKKSLVRPRRSDSLSVADRLLSARLRYSETDQAGSPILGSYCNAASRRLERAN